MASPATGSLLSRRLRLEPCGVSSPHKPGMVRRGRQEKPVVVECNRPAGHEGNHMCLLGSFERLAEWGWCKVVK